MWCVLRALNAKDDHPERADKKLKPKENTLNMEGIKYPVSLKDLNKFENQNPSISISVVGFDGKSVHPLRKSDYTKRDHNIILMLIEKDGVKHYCLVKDISRLIASKGRKNNGKRYLCWGCFTLFWCQKSLSRYQEYCNEHEAVKITLPEEGTMLKFKNYRRGEKVPFIVYADFESYIKPIQPCDPNPGSSYTKKYQKQEPSSFCYYIKCFDDEVYKPKLVSYMGKGAAKKFVKC